MIKYEIKDKTIEITYNTGLELKFIKLFLEMIDIFNGGRKQ